MSDDKIIHTFAKENTWYKLAIMRSESEPSNYFFWNGYMRHLMETNGRGAEANEVKVIELGLKECGLPELTPDELEKVQAINGLPGNLDEISFEGCVFDNDVDFQSFYFPTDVSFENANFERQANFKNANFEGEVGFTDAIFAGVANFSEAKFAKSVFFTGADFANATFFNNVSFKNHTDFNNAKFASIADFSNAKFADRAYFKEAKFGGQAFFNNSSFADRAYFNNASFADKANFKNTNFKNAADFSSVDSFKNTANFKNASFENTADFSSAKFESEVNFSASSDTPQHKGSVSFASATFKQAPAFFGRQLHEDTDWQGVIWPEPPSSKKQAGDDVRRYESLSLMMSRLEKYDDMHTFFRLSMQAKEIRDGCSVASLMSRTYGKLFDYGWGVKHAFRLWVGHIFLGFLLILGLMSINGLPQSIGVLQSFMLSFSNAHSFIGLHNGALASLYRCATAGDNSSWFNVIWVLQTLIGLPLLFFLLLTIRNRFRMR